MKIALVTILFFLGATSFGQYKEIVELKNGSIHRGHLLEQNDDQVRLKKKDGSIVVFNRDHVVSIDRYQPTVKSSGYYLRSSFGLLGGPDRAGISMQMVQGYAVNKHLQFGAGFGLEIFGNNPYIPAFIEGQFNFFKNPSSPFVRIMGGYEVPLNFGQSKGGFTTGIALGYTRFLNHRLALTTSLGYRYARLAEQQSWWDDFNTIREINRFELSVGLTFR